VALSNTFGRVFRLSTFGESHGPAMGAVIDGCPAGVIWRPDLLDGFLARRRPGSALTSARQEDDKVEILSGVFEGKTLGTPIGAVIYNRDARPADYDPARIETRRGHATDLWREKYGHSDPRGSGRASGRETVSRVIGGAVARMLVQQLHPEVRVIAFTERVGSLALSEAQIKLALEELREDPWRVDAQSLRCPDAALNTRIVEMLSRAVEEGESFGGIARLHISGLPSGLGQPVFGKFKSRLASAFLGVGAANAVELGDGLAAGSASGKDFHESGQDYGGIRGGISTGGPVSLRVAFKPTSSRLDVAKKGRHDPCIVPRAIPVLEAMAWLVLADLVLLARLDRI
jgi:chorismate synthase